MTTKIKRKWRKKILDFMDYKLIQICILFLATSLSCEFLYKNKFLKYLKKIIYIFKNLNKILKSDLISEHWKERIVFFYSIKLLFYSFYIPLMFILCISPIVIVLFLISNNRDEFLSHIYSPINALLISIVVIIYFNLRKKFSD